jgi:alpha-methylacyl-CoA racemase
MTAEEGERSPGRIPEIRRRFTEIFASRTREEWSALFDGTDACVAPVLSMADAPKHPQNLARETFIEVDGIIQPAPAPRFSRTPSQVSSPPAPAGSHTRAALHDWGVTDIDALIEAGIVKQAG